MQQPMLPAGGHQIPPLALDSRREERARLREIAVVIVVGNCLEMPDQLFTNMAQCGRRERVNSVPSVSRAQLARSAFLRVFGGVLVLPALLVLPAGTLAYWQAWVYLAVLLIPMMLTAVYLLSRDPELLERRMRTGEKDAAQSRIVALAGVCFLAVLLVPGFDRRFGWSHVPLAAVLVADLLVLLGYALFILVIRENRSASRIIEVESGQRLVATGPYAIVRHPMYAAVAVMGLASPVALGSWWAIIPALLLMPVLAARIRNEERVLADELVGYREYMRTTTHRLIPGVW